MSAVRKPAFREMIEADQDRPEVRSFHCGDERWHTELNDHLRQGGAIQDGKRPSNRTFLYCEDGGAGTILGYACIARRVARRLAGQPPSLLITFLAVDSRHQGQGVGRGMLRGLIDFARDGGAGVVELFVHERNDPAIRLYNSEGFVFQPDAESVQGEDRYPEMVLWLT